MLHSATTLLLQAAEPFFDNTLGGWIKVISFAGIVAGSVWTLWWFKARQPIKDEIRGNRINIDGIGIKVDVLGKWREGVDVELRNIALALQESQLDRRQLREDVRDTTQSVKEFIRDSAVRQDEMLKEMRALNKQVGRLEGLNAVARLINNLERGEGSD